MSSTVVHVENISSQTSEKEIRDFFSFCGKITNLSVTAASNEANSTQKATVTFEKETAAKTALLLDNTQLGSSQVHVTPGHDLGQVAASAGQTSGGSGGDGDEISQDDKPRARVVAEYLAHGYVLSDTAIQKAIALDNQHGLSGRFTAALKSFDEKFKATERAKGLDHQYGLSGHAQTGFNTLHSYFEKAIGTPTGQKLASLYTQGEKQVMDVHTEARRLADMKQQQSSSSAAGSAEQGSAAPAAGAPAAASAAPGTQAAVESAQAAVDGKSVPAPVPAQSGAPQTTGNS